MPGRFVLRSEDDTDNPIAPRLYWLGATLGRLVAYLPGGAGGRTTFISILTEGARFPGDTVCKGLIKVMYAGFDLPEFGAGGARNWRFHSGKIPTPPTYKKVTAVDHTTDTFTVPGHGYVLDQHVALQKRGKIEVAQTPTPTIPHFKYKIFNPTTDTFQLKYIEDDTIVPLTDNGVGIPDRVFVYSADNVGLFDTEQGRPNFFAGLNFGFPGLSYIEVALPTELSTGTDEPTRLQIVMDGKMVTDYTISGGVLTPTGSPISASNNALVALDLLINDGNRPAARFNADSWLAFRDRCNTAIPWVGGNDTAATPASFATTSGVTYDPATGTVTRTSGGTGKAVTAALVNPNLSIEAIYQDATGDVRLALGSDSAGGGAMQGLLVNGAGDLFYTDGTGFWNVGTANPSDRLKVAYENRLFKAYKNSVPLSMANVPIGGQPIGDLYASVYIQNTGETVSDVRIRPAGTNAAPRQVKRFTGGIVLLQKTSISEILETELHLAPGTSWQDIDGEIVILPTPDRTPVFTFNADKTASMPTNVSRVVVQNNDPSVALNYRRFSFRDADDPILTRRYVFTDRINHRAEFGLQQSDVIPYAVMNQSQMERIGETIMRLNTDLYFGFTVDAFLDSITVAKGDFVHLIAPEAGYDEAGPALCMVMAETISHSGDVETRQFILKIITNDFYSDTAHGPITPLSHTHISSVFQPPPPLVDLTVDQGGHQLPDGTFISTIEGLAQFTEQPGQRGRVWWKPLLGNGCPVTPNHTTNSFVAAAPSTSPIAPFVDTEVSVAAVDVGGVLPAGLDPDANYTLRLDSGLYKLQLNGVGAFIDFTSNGTGEIRLYPYADWVTTGTLVEPNSFQQGTFEISNVQRGFYYIVVVTETLLGISEPFNQHPVRTVEVLGNQIVPDGPTNLRAVFDGLAVTWSWDASPSQNLSGYQITDDAGVIIAPLIAALEYTESLRTPTVARRVYAVSRSGIRSTDYAALTYTKPPTLGWIEPYGGTVDQSNIFTKTAANGYSNSGAFLDHAFLTDQTDARIAFVVDNNNTRRAFGMCEVFTPIAQPSQFRAAIEFLADGTAQAVWNSAGSTSALGNYEVGEEWSLRITPSATRDEPVLKVFKRQPTTGTEFIETELFTFPSGILVPFPARVGIAVYTNGTSVYPNFFLSGTLCPTIPVIPVAAALHNQSYDFSLGLLQYAALSDSVDGAVFADAIEENKDGSFTIHCSGPGNEGYMLLGPAAGVFDPPGPTGFHLLWDGVGGVFVMNGGTTLATLTPPSFVGDDWTFAREGGDIVIRRGQAIEYVYTGGLATEALYLTVKMLSGEVTLGFSEAGDTGIETARTVENPLFGKNRVYDIPQFNMPNLTPGEFLRVDATGKFVETAPLSTTITVGDPITGGGANRVLYQNASSLLATSPEFLFDGHGLALYPKMDLTPCSLRIQPDFNSGYYATTDHIALYIDGYTGGGGNYGLYTSAVFDLLKVRNVGNAIVFNIGRQGEVFSNTSVETISALPSGKRACYTILADSTAGYYVANDIEALRITGFNLSNFAAYSSGTLKLIRVDDGAGAEFFSIYRDGKTYFPTPTVSIGVALLGTISAALHVVKTTEQLRLGYDASNYIKFTVASGGSTVLDIVTTGGTPELQIPEVTGFLSAVSGHGASWIPYNDGKIYLSSSDIILRNGSNVERYRFTDTKLVISDGRDIELGTTTGTKIGLTSSEMLGFFGTTPVTQRGAAAFVPSPADDIAGSDTVDESRIESQFTQHADSINAIIQALSDLGLAV